MMEESENIVCLETRMSRYQPPLRLPIDGACFRLRGRRFRFREKDRKSLNLLSEVCWYCLKRSDHNWGVRCRETIREIQKLNSRALLSLVIEHAEHPIYRILAIWLRGRCGGYIGTPVLEKFTNDPNDQTRKEVARALKRMNAWSQLREIAERDQCERVRRIATTEPSNSHSERLANFCRHFAKAYVCDTPRSMFVSPELEIDQGRPPRSISFIRMILERIHRLVTTQPR